MESGWSNPRLQGRILELDGIRGIAILLVLTWHYFIKVIPVGLQTWQAYALLPFHLTWSGVDLFFVLSGFLIGGILFDARQSGSYYRTFYLRRLHRIIPLYAVWFALFLVGLALAATNPPEPIRVVFNANLPLWCYPLFLQNILTVTVRDFGPAWIGITWSLAVEEQFYLLLPVMLRRVTFRGAINLALGSIIVAPLVRLLLISSGDGYFGPYALLPARSDALGYGVLIALLCRKRSTWDWLDAHRKEMAWLCVLLGTGVAGYSVKQQHVFGSGLSVIAAFYASLLLLVILYRDSRTARVLRTRWLRWLGTVAYAVYLFHQGVNALLFYAFFGTVPVLANWSQLGVTLLSLAIVVAMAKLSWTILEQPLIARAQTVYKYALPDPRRTDGAATRR